MGFQDYQIQSAPESTNLATSCVFAYTAQTSPLRTVLKANRSVIDTGRGSNNEAAQRTLSQIVQPIITNARSQERHDRLLDITYRSIKSHNVQLHGARLPSIDITLVRELENKQHINSRSTHSLSAPSMRVNQSAQRAPSQSSHATVLTPPARAAAGS